MNQVQQIVPISTMQESPGEVLAMLVNGPVTLTQRSQPVAVLIGIDQWGSIMELLEDQTGINQRLPDDTTKGDLCADG